MRETMNKWKMLGALTLAVGLVLVGTANATDQNLTNDGQNGNVAMAVAPDNAIHVVWARDTGAPPSGSDYKDVIYYMKSTDGGATWSAMKPISYAGAQVESQSVQVPSIAVDSVGKLHVVWHGTDPLNPPPGGSVQAAIGYVSSSDGGDTWTTQVNIAPNWGGGHPRIKVDPSDNNMIYVVWDDGGTSADFTRSTDGGSVWEAPRCINHPSGSGLPCHKPDIAIGPDGTLHVTMVGNSETLSPLGNIYYRFSTDQGVTWSGSQADLIYTAITPDGFHFATIEANSAGTIQVVTRDNFVNLHPDLNNTHKLGYLYYLEKPASGAWSTPVQITSGKTRDQWGGWKEEMILDPSNNLYLVYSQVTDVTAGRDVYLMKYNKVPGTWGPEVRLTDASGTQGNPQVARDSNGNLHVVYLDYGQSDIHYISLPPQTEVWVDDDWAGTATGTEVEPGKIFGYNAFATIQEGIDNVAGSTVNVAAGTYNPTSTIVINKDALTLLGPQADVDPRPSQGSPRTPGSAAEAIIDGTGGSLAMIIEVDADNVVINGLEVKSGTGDMIKQNTAHSGTTVKYCIIHDGLGDEGVQLKKCTNGVLEYNYVYDIADKGDGLNIADASSNGVIRHNEVCGIHGENAAIYIYDATDMEISDNLVYGPGGPGGNDGIKVGAKGGGDAAKTGVLVKDNVIHGMPQDGITIYMSGVTVEGNEIYNCGSENGAIYLAYAISDVTIQGNSVHDNVLKTSKRTTTAGILLENRVDAASVTINFNNIYNNTPYGVTNEAAAQVDATNNWWGDASGPTHATNSGGSGDAVSNNVAYSPWLGATKDATPMTFIVDDVGPEPVAGYIQTAINAASAGDTINVAAGKYDGFNVPVGKDNLTIQSISGAEVTTIVLGDKGEGGSSGTPPYGESYTEESEAVLGLTPGSLVTIKANGVTINGFTVTAGDDKGISVWECDSVEIKNCIFRDNTGSLNARGIQLAYSNHCVIQDNEFQNNTIGFCAFFSDNNTIQNNNLSGSHFIIYIQGGEGNTVQDNIIPEGYFGIRVEVGSSAPGEPATNNIIKGNTLNSSYAITIWNGATENTVENNNVNSIFQGVEISSGVGGGAPSPNNIVRGNDISVWAWDGVEKCDYGVALWGGDGNIVEDNSITKSEFAGIHVKASGNAIQSNNVFNNDVGMLIEDPATNNAIHFNNIAENSDYGLNNITAEEVSATNNWWGSTTGPYQATTNSHGTGDAVSDGVTYVPWLDAEYPGGNPTGGVPATLLLSTSESSVVVGGDSSTIEATLTDILANPISDTAMKVQSADSAYIDFSVTAGNGTISPAADTTDDLGHATTTFTSGTIADTNKVKGTLRGSSPTITGTVDITVTPGPLARVETTPVSTHAVVVGDVNIVAELMDTYRNHIDATDTSEVSFATTGLGTIGVTSVTADDKIQMVYTTDDSMATDTITATTTTGNYTDFSVVTTYGAAPATMTFKAADSRVVVSNFINTEALNVALFDKYGNPSAYSDYDASPQEFYNVIFTQSSGAGIVKPNIAAVNANGCCGVTYKSSTVIGNYTVTAISGNATASLVITQTHDVLAAVSLTPDTASCVGGQDVTLTAELLDRFANHIDAIDMGDVTPNLLTGRGILGTPSLDTIANVVKVVYTTYISEADTAEIEATATTFKDTSVVISALAGTLDHFALALDTDSLNVGTAVTVTITAEDIDSVRIYTYDNEDIIALTLDGTAAEASQVMWVIGTDTSYALTAEIPESTFAAGQVDITIVNEKAEAVTVTATDTAGITGTSDAITWIPITLDHFGIVVQTDPIYTGIPFIFTVIPYDTFDNITSVGLPVWWIIFGTNEPGIDLPSEPLEFNAITDYFATASNASTSLILTVGTTDGLIHGISDTITVIGLYTLSGTVGLADNPGDLSGTEVMVTGGFSDTTDAIGYYEIPGLLTGTYNIIVTHEGYHTIIESGVDISANIVKNFVLQPVVTGIEEIPTVYSLSQNKPNPFAGGTTIEYGLPKAGNVEIVVYNAAGQKVRTLVSAEEKAGYHKVSWDVTNDSGAKVGGGIYFYKITAGEFTSLKKLILLR